MNEYLALGNALHKALEDGHKAASFEGSYVHSVFTKEFNRIITDDEVFVGYPQKKKLEAAGAAMLALYTGQIKSGSISSTPYKIEEGFKIPYKNIVIVGRIDKVEFDQARGYDIIDYKSGSREPDPWFLRHNLQLTAYAWACQELYGELPRKVIWHHLRNGKRLETDRTQQDIDQLKKMIDAALKMEQHKIRYRVFHEKICEWCDYAGEGKECEDYDIEERILNAKKPRAVGVDSDRKD